MVARKRMPMGRGYVLGGGVWRATRYAAVGARERLPWVEDTCFRAASGGHLEMLQ